MLNGSVLDDILDRASANSPPFSSAIPTYKFPASCGGASWVAMGKTTANAASSAKRKVVVSARRLPRLPVSRPSIKRFVVIGKYSSIADGYGCVHQHFGS